MGIWKFYIIGETKEIVIGICEVPRALFISLINGVV